MRISIIHLESLNCGPGYSISNEALGSKSMLHWLFWYRIGSKSRCSQLSYIQCGIFFTHWGRVTHICVGKLTIIGSDNGLSPERRQAIIWTNVGILLIGPLEIYFSEILIEIKTFSLKKIRLKMSSEKCCSFRLGLDVLTLQVSAQYVYGTLTSSLTLIPGWISNHMTSKVWDEITYPFPNWSPGDGTLNMLYHITMPFGHRQAHD